MAYSCTYHRRALLASAMACNCVTHILGGVRLRYHLPEHVHLILTECC